MNENNILDTIRAKYYELRPAEQKVANYVLGNYEKIQFVSISELAEFAGVADATVTRFCRSLGLKGFNMFKVKLAACIGESNISDPQSNEGVLASGQQSAIESKTAIDETIALLDKDAICQAIDMFECADRVLCAGSGGSMRIADECAGLFSIVEAKFVSVADSHSQAAMIATMKENDIVLLVSYSGATVNGLELLELTKKMGIKSILITRFKKSPLSKLADVTLCCGSKEGPYQMGSIAAKIALLTLIDVIFKEYRNRNAQSADENIKRIAMALSDKHL
ncbi:MAG: MurR/RpiR family transcriptional regulator [Clostridia bacterium]|nr:MurR/RpiR family transcriptional regulator [Clostridia bacterium]